MQDTGPEAALQPPTGAAPGAGAVGSAESDGAEGEGIERARLQAIVRATGRQQPLAAGDRPYAPWGGLIRA